MMRARSIPTATLALSLATVSLIGSVDSSRAAAVDISGRFLYQDRQSDQFGYTGTTQDLPIRHADVEVVGTTEGAVFGSGSTDEDGNFSVTVDILAPTELYVRCLSSTDNHADYHIKVVDRFVRIGGTLDLTQSTIHAIATDEQLVDPGAPATGEFGELLTVDATGFEVAQVFNVLDCAVDAFDYMAEPYVLGRYPEASEFVVFGWNFTVGSAGSNYGSQGILLTARSTDTDAWSDNVILHEAGHWANDMFSEDDNTGGAHIIGDNEQDPRLSYGEGYATFYCAQVREFRSARPNGEGQPVDEGVSIYADLGVPPTIPNPGGLEFAYDFESGTFNSGVSIGQIGMSSETNVTSVMWDLVDGAATPDETPGVDDDAVDEDGDLSWDVLRFYMTTRGPTNWLTIEDFHDGWFARHGQDFLRTELDEIFVDLAEMPLKQDPFEDDDDVANASVVTPLTYDIAPGGPVLINEIDVENDRIEIFNGGDAPVDLTGWKIATNRNGLPTNNFYFPEFTLYPGSFVTVHAGGDPADNGPTRIFDPNFLIFWILGDDGACGLFDAANTPLDFVRWDNVSGEDPNQTAIPNGLTWTGNVFAPEEGESLGRDKDGTDSDDAADWLSRPYAFGSPNFDDLRAQTIYPQGDRDVISVDLLAGELLTIQAVAPHSSGSPVIELLDADGNVASESYRSFGQVDLAVTQLLAPNDTTIYARFSNRADFTEYTPLDLAIFRRPAADVPGTPSALIAVAAGENDLSDPVSLSWLNGGAYDAVEVWRDGVLRATLSGSATSFNDTRPRGLYTYQVRGMLGSSPTEFAQAAVFAGVVSCYTGDDFESGTSNLVLEGTWDISDVLAEEGTFALTESPANNYFNNQNVSAEILEPAELLGYTTLEFDHICATEVGFDFGFVEISTNQGTSWITLAQYDGDDAPGWEDGDADPEDWVHESIDLSEYVAQQVRIRFRFFSDAFVVEDGWFIDNVMLSDPLCETVTSTPEFADFPVGSLRAGPNPFGDSVTLRFRTNGVGTAGSAGSAGTAGTAGTADTAAIVTVDIIDVTGRRLRELYRGPVEPMAEWTWDGRDARGHSVGAGVYFARIRTSQGASIARITRVE